jgi:hypothetical protein
MHVVLFRKIIPSVQSVIWLPYLLFYADIFTLWIAFLHPIGEYFPKIDFTVINSHADEFYEIIVAGAVVSFLFAAGIFLFSGVFMVLKKLGRKNQNYWNFKNKLNEQSSEIKICYYGLAVIFFIALTNPFVSIFRHPTLYSGRVNFFITHSLELKTHLVLSDLPIPLTLLLICLFVSILFIGSEKIIKKQKIKFDFNLFPILFYSMIIVVVLFFLLISEVFVFVPLLNEPPEDYVAPPILAVYACQVLFYIIYRYIVKKTVFKPADILPAAPFMFLMTLSLIISFPISLLIGSSLEFAYELSEPQYYVIAKIISFILSIFIFEIGAKFSP